MMIGLFTCGIIIIIIMIMIIIANTRGGGTHPRSGERQTSQGEGKGWKGGTFREEGRGIAKGHREGGEGGDSLGGEGEAGGW